MALKPLYNEQDLLAKTAMGDEHAFGILYEQYHKKIYVFALQILNAQTLAEEVMQVTMLKLWQMGDALTTIHHLDAYLKTIAKNTAYNMLRRLKLEQSASERMSSDWTENHNDTEEHIILNDTKKILEEAIAALPPQQRLVYQLCHQEGLKYEEVAEKLSLSPLSVQTYMKLALRFLRNYVSKRTDIGALLIILKFYIP